MATVLDIGLLNFLTPAFVFLLVFVIVYALIKKMKFFGDNFGFNAAIAFAISMLFIIVPEARTIITLFTPWITLMVFLVLFIFMYFMFLGVKQESLVEVAKDPTFITFSIIFIIIFFLVAMSTVYGPFLAVNQNPGFWNSAKRVLFHPRSLGLLFLLTVAAYAVKMLGSSPIIPGK